MSDTACQPGVNPGRVTEPEIARFEASDGYRFHYRHWHPAETRPLGYVVAVHGIQSHSGWYEYSSRRLCDAGYEVCFLDRRGAGLNKEARGDAPHPDRLVNDVAQFLAETRARRNREAPTSPVVLLGLSWSGKLAATVAARRAELIDALALLYPGICARIRPRRHQILGLRLGMLLGQSGRRVTIPLNDPELFTDDPDWQEFIRNDSLALREATLSFLAASRELDVQADRAAERIRCPVLLMLAGRDRIIDNAATRRYFERIPAAHRRVIEYPEARHTLEFEPNREQIAADLLEWLASVRRVC